MCKASMVDARLARQTAQAPPQAGSQAGSQAMVNWRFQETT
jgi:hypothetical protein